MSGEDNCFQGRSNFRNGPTRHRVVQISAVTTEMRGVSIVNANISFNYLHFNIADPRLPKIGQSAPWAIKESIWSWSSIFTSQSKPHTHTHTHKVTTLDGETQIAPPPPAIEALEILQ